MHRELQHVQGKGIFNKVNESGQSRELKGLRSVSEGTEEVR